MEIWKDIVGYEGLYKISSNGQVIGPKGRILKTWVSEYRYVSLYMDKVRSVKRVSRLVASSFIANPENKPEVNHKNGNKLDDRKRNLEWSTRSENQTHAVKKGLQKRLTGAENKQSKPVHQYDTQNTLIKTWPGIKAAGRAGYKSSCISDVCNGKQKIHAGFIWKFS